jgi:hypothetical protein
MAGMVGMPQRIPLLEAPRQRLEAKAVKAEMENRREGVDQEGLQKEQTGRKVSRVLSQR